MHDERSHPLLQQTPLSVNPFIDLPKAPTLPHNYASLPSTLPATSIAAPPAPSNPELPAYVTSGSSGFAAHPRSIVAQNEALLQQLQTQREEGKSKVEEWEQSINERELAEKRRKAPGWLDSEVRVLQPEKKGEHDMPGIGASSELSGGGMNFMDSVEGRSEVSSIHEKDVDDLGEAMDRAFGPHEMG